MRGRRAVARGGVSTPQGGMVRGHGRAPGVPAEPSKLYDLEQVVRAVVDDGRLLEIHEHFAQNIVVGFARIGGAHRGGRGPGQVPAGCLDIKTDTLCPLLGLLHYPARHVRRRARPPPGGSIGNMAGSSLVSEAPLCVRRGRRARGDGERPQGFRGAHDVMASKHLRADYNLAFPAAEIAVMGPEGAVGVVYRGEIQRAAVPTDARARFVEDHKAKFANPCEAAELGFIEEVIYPRVLRTRLARALDLLRAKRDKDPPKEHGNIPL